MRLTVTYPTEEFERAEYFGDHTRESADAHLSTMPRGWLEATLDEDREVAWRRFPSSPWVPIAHWPRNPTARDTGVTVNMDALESWLRAVGVRVRWDVLKRHPFPGQAIAAHHARERGAWWSRSREYGGAIDPTLPEVFSTEENISHWRSDLRWRSRTMGRAAWPSLHALHALGLHLVAIDPQRIVLAVEAL